MQSAGESTLQLNIPQMNSEAGSYINAASKNFSDAGSIMSALAQANEASKNAAAERALKSEIAMNEMMAKIYGIQSENMNTDKKVAMEKENNIRNNETSERNNIRTTDASKYAANAAAAAQRYSADTSANASKFNSITSQLGTALKAGTEELTKAISEGDYQRIDELKAGLGYLNNQFKQHTGYSYFDTQDSSNTNVTPTTSSTSTSSGNKVYGVQAFDNTRNATEQKEYNDTMKYGSPMLKRDMEKKWNRNTNFPVPTDGNPGLLFSDEKGNEHWEEADKLGATSGGYQNYKSAAQKYNRIYKNAVNFWREKKGITDLNEIHEKIKTNKTLQNAMKEVQTAYTTINDKYLKTKEDREKRRDNEIRETRNLEDNNFAKAKNTLSSTWGSELPDRERVALLAGEAYTNKKISSSLYRTLMKLAENNGETYFFGTYRKLRNTDFESMVDSLEKLHKLSISDVDELTFENLLKDSNKG